MAIKKTVRALNLPGVHPGIAQKIREGEEAELKGEEPRNLEGPQKIIRPALDATTGDRIDQARTVGLVEPAIKVGADGRLDLADVQPFMPGVDLDDVWDTLSENRKIQAGAIERFRLEMDVSLLRAAGPWEKPHELGGRLDARNLNRSQENIYAEIEAYAYLLAEDSRHLLMKFVDETRSLIAKGLQQNAISGIDTANIAEILRDWLHKLLYQELVSRQRRMGDRGIRRICANVELADQIYEKLKPFPNFSIRDQLLQRLIHVHQDLGYTAYAARVSYRGTRMHRAYGARIFTDELNRYRSLFTHDELKLARRVVATHSAAEMPFATERVTAIVRAVDHLAPFAPHRVYMHLAKIPDCALYLDDMLDAVSSKNYDALGAHQELLGMHLEGHDIEPALRDDLLASFRPFHKLADPIDLADLAGDIAGIQLDPSPPQGGVVVQLQPNEFARKYQVLFDCQQDQLTRVGRDVGITQKDLVLKNPLRLEAEGSGFLTIGR